LIRRRRRFQPGDLQWHKICPKLHRESKKTMQNQANKVLKGRNPQVFVRFWREMY
jgi:hypothetical protein